MIEDNIIPKNFYKNNLDFFEIKINENGEKIVDKSMKNRLGFLPSSIWKPDIKITKYLKNIINDKSQVRETMNANRSDRRHGVNNGKCSVFNPHLAQMILSAYCPKGAKIYDAFGGGRDKGIYCNKNGI